VGQEAAQSLTIVCIPVLGFGVRLRNERLVFNTFSRLNLFLSIGSQMIQNGQYFQVSGETKTGKWINFIFPNQNYRIFKGFVCT